MQPLPILHSGTLSIIILPKPSLQGPLLELVAALALRGPLRVLDGGNAFRPYPLAQALRRHTPTIQPVLERIQLARAFTCYQVAALLWQSPALASPSVVLDMLATFQDESVPFGERRRLLDTCLPALRALCQTSPVLVSIRPGDPILQAQLLEAADQVWQPEEPPPPPVLRLPLGEV
jgi:hypothetical protein